MTETAQTFVEHFGALKDGLPGAGLPWLAALRESGMERFAARGLPTPRNEAWKYTNLRPLEKIAFGAPNGEAVRIDRLPSLLPAGASENHLVFVNGRYRADLSTLKSRREGVRIGSLADALAEDGEELAAHLGRIAPVDGQPLLDLNTALMGDGLLLRLSRGAAVKTPIEVIYIAVAGEQPLAYHPRNLIVLEPNSQAVVIEHHVSFDGGTTLANSATEIARPRAPRPSTSARCTPASAATRTTTASACRWAPGCRATTSPCGSRARARAVISTAPT
jgi:Fe-S cluster assembly protein SufD